MQLGKTIQLITKPDGGIIKHLVKLRENKSYRSKTARCVVQADQRLLKELVYHTHDESAQHTIPKKIAFYSNGDQDEIQSLVQDLPKTHQFVCLTNPTFMKKLTGLNTVDPVNCFVVELAKPPERPILLQDEIEERLEEGKQEQGDEFRPNFRQTAPSSFVVINHLQDPGNVGNILRCCVGFGYKHVYFVDGSVDGFNEKVLRASRGALLLRDENKRAVLSYETGTWDRVTKISNSYNMPIFMSDTEKECSTPLSNLHTENSKKIVVLNNEAHGIDEELRKEVQNFGANFVHIPMSPYCNSLNVASAAAVILHSLRDNVH